MARCGGGRTRGRDPGGASGGGTDLCTDNIPGQRHTCWLSLSPLLTLAASNSWMRVMLLVYDSLDATACAGRPFEPWGGASTTLWHLILQRRLV